MPLPQNPAPRPDPELVARLAGNLAAVRSRIDAACARAARDPGEVRVVAVTKTADAGAIRAFATLGQTDVGENRVASLVEKHMALADELPGVRWHMIGHLQRNKARRVLPHIDLLHSGDGLKLLTRLDGEVSRLPRDTPLAVLVQVNVSGEGSKGGFAPADLPAALERIADLRNLRATGLMTMAPAVSDPEEARPVFRRLRELRDEAHDRGYLGGLELSMGMTDDFDVAVEEGATLVRLGRILLAGGAAETPVDRS